MYVCKQIYSETSNQIGCNIKIESVTIAKF